MHKNKPCAWTFFLLKAVFSNGLFGFEEATKRDNKTPSVAYHPTTAVFFSRLDDGRKKSFLYDEWEKGSRKESNN
ncbi:Hypothetical protein NTJ_10993 [Nesidiocoris tenuis]|uniref:Secreted protein n=1 Tax=Nesidiocoris tenuis TaxID=355587 RepID=A0ABN7B3G2_9HEMI|nr:Hypothetical protein NTJ_10993 [Nesidiocoris tenuis]